MQTSFFSSFAGPAALVSIIIGWLTFVRWTRDSRAHAKHELRQQFWIDHSVDLPYAVGEYATPETTNKLLIIKGLEISEFGWWFEVGRNNDPYILAEPREAYRMFRNRMSFFRKKIQYYLYRNVIPFASLKMECSLLVEAQNCRLSMMESIEYDEQGREIGMSGPTITDKIDYLNGYSPLWDDLYKLGLDTYDYYDADEAMQQLRTSPFVKDPPQYEVD